MAVSLLHPSHPVALLLRRTRVGLRTGISPDSASYKWWVAGTLMLNVFIVTMNNATANLALPSIMTTFGISLGQAQWVITAYMIASAVTIPTVGWLGNVLGNRNLLLVSLMVFVGGSALCGLAWSGPTLITFRILQGLGAGPIQPMAMTFSIQTFPPHQRGLAMGLYGLGISCGPVIGPVLGGYVTRKARDGTRQQSRLVSTEVLGHRFSDHISSRTACISNTSDSFQAVVSLMAESAKTGKGRFSAELRDSR